MSRKESPFMTVPEAARTLHISEMWIRRAFDAGDIPGFRAGRAYRVLRAFVISIVRRCEAGEQLVIEEYGREWKARQAAAAALRSAPARPALAAAAS